MNDAKTILLVDDDDRYLTMLVDDMREWEGWDSNFYVLTAENGEKALKTLESKRVDLLVTDLRMPAMNGFELVSHMKERYPGIPVIVMSSFLDCQVEADLRIRGALKCIDKSNVDVLKEMILKI